MITIAIDPILISLGPFTLTWHSLLMVIAIGVGVWFPVRLAIKAGLSADILYSMAVWGIPGGIVGARLVHVVDYWNYYSANPGAIFAIWEGGLAVWGAILGGTLAAVIFTRIRGVAIAAYADLAALGLLLAQAIGRIGDVINGEHISTSTSLPWGVVYTHPESSGFLHSLKYGAVHPAVGYELLMDLLIFGALWKLRGRIRPDGTLFLLYLVIYSFGRFFLSFFRLDSNTVFLGINQAQWLSLIVLVVALPLLLLRQASRRKSKPVS